MSLPYFIPESSIYRSFSFMEAMSAALDSGNYVFQITYTVLIYTILDVHRICSAFDFFTTRRISPLH